MKSTDEGMEEGKRLETEEDTEKERETVIRWKAILRVEFTKLRVVSYIYNFFFLVVKLKIRLRSELLKRGVIHGSSLFYIATKGEEHPWCSLERPQIPYNLSLPLVRRIPNPHKYKHERIYMLEPSFPFPNMIGKLTVSLMVEGASSGEVWYTRKVPGIHLTLVSFSISNKKGLQRWLVKLCPDKHTYTFTYKTK